MVYLYYMEEMNVLEKETARQNKRRYYHINIWVTPEVANNLEEISYFFIRDYIKELLNNPSLILSVPREIASEFFTTNGYILKRIHASKELHDIWKVQPIGIKKRLYYLVNKKILEVLNDELRTTRAATTS